MRGYIKGEGGGGGGGGDVTLNPNTGSSLTGNNFDVLGQTSGSAQAMEAVTDGGQFFIENRTIQTPYVVDSSTPVGERGTYTTIQTAINAAVADGASNTNYKVVFLRSGTYNENITLPPGIILKADKAQSSNYPVTIIGNVTLSGGFTAMDSISLIGQVSDTTEPCFFRASDCVFINTEAEIFTISNTGGFNFVNCDFSGVLGTNSFVFGSSAVFRRCNGTNITVDFGSLTFSMVDSRFDGFEAVCTQTILQFKNNVLTDSSEAVNLIEGSGSGYIIDCVINGTIDSQFNGQVSGCTSRTQPPIETGYTPSSYPFSSQGNFQLGFTSLDASIAVPISVGNQHYIGVNSIENNSLVRFQNKNFQEGQEFIIKDVGGNSATNNIIIDSASNWATFSGNSSLLMNQNDQLIILRFDGVDDFNVILNTADFVSGGSTPIKSCYFKASDFDALETDFAPLNQDNGSTARILSRAFDDTTEEFVNFSIKAPSDIDTSGTVTFRVWAYAETAAASSFVQLTFDHRTVDNSESWDGAYTSEDSGDIEIDDTQNNVTEATWTETVTNLGWSADDYIMCRLSRIAPTGTNLSGDLRVIGFSVEIPRA